MKALALRKVISAVSVLAIVAIPLTAFAQPTLTTGVINSYVGIVNILARAASWLLGLLLALAVVFLVYAGWLYLNSGGEEEGVSAAKQYIIYAVVAIIVGVLAKALVALVGVFLGGVDTLPV